MDYDSEGIGVATLTCLSWLNGRSNTFLYVYTTAFIVIVDLLIISN